MTEENLSSRISTEALSYAYRSNFLHTDMLRAKALLEQQTGQSSEPGSVVGYIDAQEEYQKCQKAFAQSVELAGVLLRRDGCLPEQIVEAA